MGLDMYACTLREAPATPVDFKAEEVSELHYWRKHPNLHGWMERLYREKGGTDPDFNCVNLQLTAEDLDRLEAAIRNRTLPPTSGFFFGASDGSESDDDLAFVAKAREALAAGLTVFYSSWW
ncbi:phosphoglycerate kinase [Sinorhizobium fredii]|uniref:phosphoglycerate kinase n=1 Tax=Rhizobium fredii TaxID=380 RepID=UPI00351504FC